MAYLFPAWKGRSGLLGRGRGGRSPKPRRLRGLGARVIGGGRGRGVGRGAGWTVVGECCPWRERGLDGPEGEWWVVYGAFRGAAVEALFGGFQQYAPVDVGA